MRIRVLLLYFVETKKKIMKTKITFCILMIVTLTATGISQSWQNLNAPVGITLMAINVNNNSIFGTANGFAIHRSFDGGANWTTAATEPAPSGMYLYQHFTCTKSGALLVGLMDFSNTYGTLFPLLRSTDNGDSWTYVGPFQYSTSSFYNAPDNTVYGVASGSYGKYLLQSSDDGITFTIVADSVLDIAIADNNDIYALMISSVNANKLAKSTDGGNTWTDLTATGMPAQPIRIIRCPNGTIFITDGSNSNPVVRSMDNGASFSGISQIFPLLWNGNSNNVFASQAGVNSAFRSDDNGASWEDVTSGLASNLLGYVVSNQSGTVYGFGSGNIYKFIGTTGINDSGIANHEINIFPNPSNGNFEVTSANHPISRLEVFTSFGVRIMHGQNSGRVDLSNSPKGIYLVKIYAGTKSNTRKIVIQ